MVRTLVEYWDCSGTAARCPWPTTRSRLDHSRLDFRSFGLPRPRSSPQVSGSAGRRLEGLMNDRDRETARQTDRRSMRRRCIRTAPWRALRTSARRCPTTSACTYRPVDDTCRHYTHVALRGNTSSVRVSPRVVIEHGAFLKIILLVGQQINGVLWKKAPKPLPMWRLGGYASRKNTNKINVKNRNFWSQTCAISTLLFWTIFQ